MPVHFPRWLTLLLGLAASSLPAAAQTVSGGIARSPTDEVLAALKTLREAGLHRDVSVLGRIYALEYFHTNPDGSLMSREQVLASYRAPPTMSFSSADTEEQRVLLRGGFAVVSERLSLHGKTAKGYAFISRYRVTYVLEHRQKLWQFLNSHSSFLGIDSTGTR